MLSLLRAGPVSVAVLQSSPVVEEKVKATQCLCCHARHLGALGAGRVRVPVVLNYKHRPFLNQHDTFPAVMLQITASQQSVYRAMTLRRWQAGLRSLRQPQRVGQWCRDPTQQMSTHPQPGRRVKSPGWHCRGGQGGYPVLWCQTAWLGHLEPWAQSQQCDHDPTGRQHDPLGLRL